MNYTTTCSVCFNNNTALLKTGKSDSFSATWFSKLLLCVPQVEWKEDDLICHSCIEQLEIVDAFRKMCIHTDILRKQQNSQLSTTSSCTVTNVVCFHCTKSFDSKSTLICHIQNEHQFDTIADGKTNVKPVIINNYTCERCHKCYKNPSLFKKHTKMCLSRAKETNESQATRETVESTQNTKEESIELRNVQNIKKTSRAIPRLTKFPCNFCSKIFTTSKKLVMHALDEHNADPKSIKPYSCDECDSKFCKSSNLLQHKMYHQKNRTNICSFCGKGFITKNDLKIHEKQHLNKREYSCEFCPKSFNTHKDLRSHKLVVHADPNTWNHLCTVCDKRFPIKSNYDRHMRRHTGEKPFSCHICEKSFIDKVVLQKHMVSHTNVRAFKCDHCDKEYKHKRILDIHLARVHSIGHAKVPVRVKKYFCHICPKSYFAKNKLTRHLCVHTGERPFSCDFCKKKFTDKSYVKQHLRNAHNVCEIDENKC